MPKKTRKEKIAAQTHKKNAFDESSIHITFPHKNTPTSNEITAQPETRSTVSSKPKAFDPTIEKTTIIFKNDLKKSLAIIAGILALELGLYYASMQGLLKFM